MQNNEELNLKNIKGLIFDFDGTLYDYSRITFRVFLDNPFNSLGFLKERMVRRKFAGCDFLDADCYYNAFFSELSARTSKSAGSGSKLPAIPGKTFNDSSQKISQDKIDKKRKWFFDTYMACLIRVLKKYYKPRPGLKELLVKIDTPLSPQAAIYSDFPVLKERMEAIGLPVYNNIKLYGPESFGAQKPAVRPFLKIAESFNLKPEEILVIGDRTDTDGKGAINAGMHFYHVCSGNWDNLVKKLTEKLV